MIKFGSKEDEMKFNSNNKSDAKTDTKKEIKKETKYNLNSKYMLGVPDYIKSIGSVYPILVENYHDFLEHQRFLSINKEHLKKSFDGSEKVDNETNNETNNELNNELNSEMKLLDFIIIIALQEQDKKIIDSMEKLFSLVLRKKVCFTSTKTEYGFIIDEKNSINRFNYDELREILMKQNILFEPKVYKNKLTQEWAEKALKANEKSGLKTTFEDMMSLVSCFKGLTYEQIRKETIYSIYVDFSRINSLKNYDTGIQYQCVSTKKIDISHFAECIEFKSPYEDLFKSKDKLKNLNEALGSKV